MAISSIAFVLVVAVAACSGQTPVSPEAPSETTILSSGSSSDSTTAEVELRYDETVEYQDLVLEWLELEDSRCPTGVTCVWAGQMVATVEVARADEEAVEVELLRRVGREPESARAFGYELRLLEVDPHPKEGVTPARGDFVARIEIAGP